MRQAAVERSRRRKRQPWSIRRFRKFATSVFSEASILTTHHDDPRPQAARRNDWQKWVNLALGLWLFVSPWILSFGTGAETGNAPGAGVGMAPVGTAGWNAWILGLIIFFVALSATLGSMLQAWLNLLLAVWVFIAPWVLGFTQLGSASWTHWIVGALVFLVSLSLVAPGGARRVDPAHAGGRPTTDPRREDDRNR